MPYFELNGDDEKAEKFWAVTQDGTRVTLRFGAIGTDGETKVLELATPVEANHEVAKQVKEKTAEGYFETFEYNEEDRNDPSFIGIFCAECDSEIGYDPCPDCEE